MTSITECVNTPLFTSLYENEQNEREIIQRRLINKNDEDASSNVGTRKSLLTNHHNKIRELVVKMTLMDEVAELVEEVKVVLEALEATEDCCLIRISIICHYLYRFKI